MKTLVALAGLVLVISACGTDAGDDEATDRSAGRTASAAAPSPVVTPPQIPAEPAAVRSRSTATVMDVGDGAPMLCLGPIAESYPPQCTGPAVMGWDWDGLAPHVERQGDVRWGTYAVTGTWDGKTFTVSDAVPGALYDPAFEAPALPAPSRDYDDADLDAIVDGLDSTLPGLLSAFVDQSGHVVVDVEYDDGSLQDLVDETYGDGVVVVSGALVDVDG
ncbi:hypothetical protein ABFT23_21570 [Nocardioides sp. C4-1]|uniref:hypothetical protein n=1 Tax=Nocardioides sp. C4-1 TaxID=3151851 RepID=UPI003264B0FD